MSSSTLNDEEPLRYASLVGSLTAYGVAVGFPALAAFYYFKKLNGFLIFIILSIGAALSLQKSALANIAIVIIFAWWLKFIEFKNIFTFAPTIGVVAILIFYISEFNGSQFETVLRYMQGVLTSETELSNDVNFFESMVDRFTALPYEALIYFETHEFLYGAGVFGGAGAMGYDNIPMAHNGLIELILMFGVFVGGPIILFLIYLLIKSILIISNRLNAANTEIGFLSASYIQWFVNYVFSGGGLFQPVSASIFWLLVFRMRYIFKSEKI
ncbi:hypothetical protein [Limnohabitans planktonicus]|uniref:hypothetical protein n=1 Tax=Limnohabitans planktonicus TaxID=540060 RepID=UPI00105764AC|nr:hypothetical protein [Limnohabitans planktonicus]